jgi:hypothetical protein
VNFAFLAVNAFTEIKELSRKIGDKETLKKE